jgi:hypothetical protein
MTSRADVHAVCVATVIFGLLPALCLAAGSPDYARRIKSVPELIVEGERPEISACLYSAQLAVSKSEEFESIRWSDSVSDESVVQEYHLGADLVRVTKFEASALTAGTGLFSLKRWVDVLVACEQINEKAPVVTLRLKFRNP